MENLKNLPLIYGKTAGVIKILILGRLRDV
jgi:hypothetical protein